MTVPTRRLSEHRIGALEQRADALARRLSELAADGARMDAAEVAFQADAMRAWIDEGVGATVRYDQSVIEAFGREFWKALTDCAGEGRYLTVAGRSVAAAAALSRLAAGGLVVRRVEARDA